MKIVPTLHDTSHGVPPRLSCARWSRILAASGGTCRDATGLGAHRAWDTREACAAPQEGSVPT
jgi:hypothetical protein